MERSTGPDRSKDSLTKPVGGSKGLAESLENASVAHRESTTILPPPASDSGRYVPRQVCNLDEVQTFTTRRQYGPEPQTIAWVYEEGKITFFDSARDVSGAFYAFKDECVIDSALVLRLYDKGGNSHAEYGTVQRLKDTLNPPPIVGLSASIVHTAHTAGGYVTASLTDAREAHEAHGGFLLQVGNRPPKFVVCQEDQAVECWGRTIGQLRDLETLHGSTEV